MCSQSEAGLGRVAQVTEVLRWVQSHPILATVIWVFGKVVSGTHVGHFASTQRLLTTGGSTTSSSSSCCSGGVLKDGRRGGSSGALKQRVSSRRLSWNDEHGGSLAQYYEVRFTCVPCVVVSSYLCSSSVLAKYCVAVPCDRRGLVAQAIGHRLLVICKVITGMGTRGCSTRWTPCFCSMFLHLASGTLTIVEESCIHSACHMSPSLIKTSTRPHWRSSSTNPCSCETSSVHANLQA